MSVPEVAWRIRNKVRDSIDRCAWNAQRPLPDFARIVASNDHPASTAGDVRVVGTLPAPGQAGGTFEAAWKTACIEEADLLLAGRMRLFGREIETGRPVNWNYEYNAQRATPMAYAGSIDYRDHAETGDCKWAWEPSRHQHLVVLGRAYRLTGDTRYAAAVIEHIESWIEQCPVGLGMQWRSPLELAIRLINWVWALALIEPAGVVANETGQQILAVVFAHLRDISRKYSRYSSANNHTVGEAAGVYVAAAYWPQLIDAVRLRDEAKSILIEEMTRQVLDDGVHAELAVGYHLFALQFFTVAGLAGRRIGDEFPPVYWQRLEKMYGFVAALLEGGAPPLFNDCDDGYVLNLGRGPGAFEDWLAAGARIFDRRDFASGAGEFRETAFWLLGGEESAAKGTGAESDQSQSTAFKDAGIYLLQSGRRGANDRISLTFDCGALGFGSIAAHGHADALSITLRVGGRDILIDPGTYDYFTHRQWRDYFRSSRAHNTIVVNECDQSEPLGLFNWGRRANARCLRFETSGALSIVEGEHDGYRATHGLMHRRRVQLDRNSGRIEIEDQLSGNGEYSIAQSFHLSSESSVSGGSANQHVICSGAIRVVLETDAQLEVACIKGDEKSAIGWESCCYHNRVPSCTLIGRRRVRGDTIIRSVIKIQTCPD